jgi:hypothetical protein
MKGKGEEERGEEKGKRRKAEDKGLPSNSSCCARAIFGNTRMIIRTMCIPGLMGFVLGALLVIGFSNISFSSNSGLITSKNIFTQMFSRTSRRAYLFSAPTGAVTSDLEPHATPMPTEIPKTPDWLENTAIVTLATGDTSARDAIALMRSLRDSNTQVPTLLVLLSRGGLGSADCNNQEWRKANKREHIACSAADTIAPEIASQEYLDSFAKMNVQFQVVDPIPDTPYTVIPGGRQIFWGMAFNKLLVFNMSQYRKLMWMDSDAYVVKNLDHLMKEPMLTGAFVAACCHPGGPAYAGGGIWVVEPSAALFADVMDMISKPVPGTENDPWYVPHVALVQQ